MHNIEVIRVIEKNDRFILSLVKSEDGSLNLIKEHAADHPTLDSMAQLKNELYIESLISHPGLRKVRGEIFHDGRKGLLLEYIPGKTIKGSGPLDIVTFFNFSIQLTKTLCYTHEKGIFHRDISSNNILKDENTGQYYLIDFGTAIQGTSNKISHHLIGTPTYVSPELTGRLQMNSDLRSDIYSLGVVFYEILSGGNPFEDDSEMQIVYKHLTHMPTPLDQLGRNIPATLSRVISKMLAKKPVERYQSAAGLLTDLEESYVLFKRNVDPSDFIAGKHEIRIPFNNTTQFIGYQTELNSLKSHIPKLLSGQTHLHAISGPEGIGKSSIINELLPGLYDEQVMYLKLDKVNGIKPYASLFELFETILSRINEESESQISKRKEKFNREQFSDLGFLVEMIPSLELFVEITENTESITGIQSQNRFRLALQDLLRSFALMERPIVIHVENETLIDKESLDFFKKFVEDIQDEYIWILLESDNEQVWNELQSKEKSHVNLNGLRNDEISTIFHEMVNGEFIHEEKILLQLNKFAKGNPGKAVLLIKYWHENNFLEFDLERNYWFWNESPDLPVYPESMDVFESFEDPVQQDIIEWASLIEGKFSFKMISHLSEHSEDDLHKSLEKLNIQSQLISSRNGSHREYYRLSSIVNPYDIIKDPNTHAEKHIKIAGYLESETNDNFRVAYHLNEAKNLGNTSFDMKKALIANLHAGLVSKEQGAFSLARNFFQNSMDYLDLVKDIDPGIQFSLFLNSAELAQLEGDHLDTAKHFEKAFELAKTDIDKAEIYTRQLTLFNHQGKLEECLKTGGKALEILGFPIPEKAGKMGILRKLIKLYFKIGKSKPDKFVSLPPIKDKKVILALQIIEDLHPAIFNKSSDLLAYVILSSFELILKYGNSPEGYSAYAGFGAILALGFNNYEKGWAFTLVGTEMTKKFPNKLYHGRGLYSKGGWLIYYMQPMQTGIPVLEEGIKLSTESGDFTYATFGAMNMMQIMFMMGVPLREFEKKVDEYTAFTYQIGYKDILSLSLISKAYILILTNRKEEAKKLENRWFNGEDLLKYTEETSFKYVTIYYKLLQANILYYEGKIVEAYDLISQCDKLTHVLTGPPLLADYYFLKGIISYEIAILKAKKDSSVHHKALKRSIKKLDKYTRLIEDNFGHRHKILMALELDYTGSHFKSRKMMRAALELSRKYEYTHLEAMAAQYLAKWFYKKGQRDYARLHFRDAVNAYERWGASYLIELISKELEEFSTVFSSSSIYSGSRNLSRHSQSGGFSNPEVLMQSALSISDETDIEALLGVMNQIFLEQAGATRSLLFILSHNELGLLYEMDQDKKNYYPFPGKKFKSIEQIPRSIIQLVQRSQNPVIIKDTTKEQRFKFETYLRNANPFSILVIPMIYRGVLSGIIYFENTLLTNAFSDERQELIKLLSGQFAVSLQNAQLVEELESRVRERTLALESEKERSDHLLKNILPAETAEELKINGTATPKYYENVTVMFTDFIAFTSLSEKLHPTELVKMLDFYFREFDQIIERHGLEKIKTIGDAYMCVTGLPVETDDHAQRTINAAFEILKFIEETSKNKKYELKLRIGIHSGPVISGVVGENKFAFDIWGDTVNTASRMENHSEPGRINITKQTMELLNENDHYTYEYRGKVPAKNKGEIEMYFINENSSNGPNHNDAIKFILDQLETGLSEKLTYHSLEHTKEIMENVKRVGQKEGISEKNMILLLTAAAYHDSGFLNGPADHEEKSCEMVKKTLPGYGYDQEQTDQICKMIRATKIPQEPSDKLSMILCDADLYYLGTNDFYETGSKLFEEFKYQNIVQNEKDWIKLQINFLNTHYYHTETVRNECNENKQKFLDELKLKLQELN